mmetsp:Transcript_17813/g.69063  ORF Transcript_17813/g.69063 Transcript_17813/m.69063 type:complete len:337 (+) Transcript_17813:39-1049(+)
MLPTTEPASGAQSFDPKKLLLELPRLSKAISCVVLVLFMIGFLFPGTRSVFAITAEFFLASPTAFIKVFTAGFFEVSVISFLVNIVLFLMEGRYLEPIWGSKEFLKYVLLVNIATSISTYIAIVVLYMATMNEHFLYTHRWYGFSGITSGLTVAVKQASPDLEVRLFGAVPLGTKLVPLLIVCVNLVFLVLQLQVASVPFVLFGVYYSWFYLRFIQRRGEHVGDFSPEFSFSSFFPEPVSGVVGTMARVCYRVVSLTGLWKLLGIPGLDGSGEFKPFPTPATKVSAASSDNVDAERRRARAAQALEKRLAQMEKQKQSLAPKSTPPAPAADAAEEQ